MQYNREAVRIATQKIALANAERAAALLEADIAAYGEDTHPVGTVWKFTKVYGADSFSGEAGKGYNYVAFKAHDSTWYSTSGMRYTYAELVMFLLTDGDAIRREDIVELVPAKTSTK
jgi:hypothetical protein